MSLAAPYLGDAEEGLTAQSGKPLSIAGAIDWLIAPLASQKIAVATFAYGIFVIFVGTLAQTEMDLWEVMPRFFRAWIMWVDINLIPGVFYKSWQRWENVPLIPLPGGMFVGVTMMINMLFANTRWILQLRTKLPVMLIGGTMVISGWLLTLFIILNGHSRGELPFTWEQFWTGFQVSLIALWVTYIFAYFWIGIQPSWQLAKWSLLRIVMLVLFGVLLLAISGFVWFMLFQVDYPGPEMLRIVWQLLQGTVAGIVLFGGCWLVFQKRGGVVLLHQGMLLLMMNELFVARYNVEYNMPLGEGQTSNVLRDVRSPEIALIDRSNPEQDKHFVVPFGMIVANAELNEVAAKEKKSPTPIADEKQQLPLTVTVLQYTRNADLRKLKKDEKSLATAGVGLDYIVVPLTSAKGTDTGGGVDLGAAYVNFKDKAAGKDLGTYLLFLAAAESEGSKVFETVTVGDHTYLAGLRFKREWLPFTVQLKDVAKDDYVGTATPKNYSSDIVLKDSANGVNSDIHIKMNDPLRYNGMTFYQSSYDKNKVTGVEYTTLSVVRNNAFLVPYVSLMIITVGMISHFIQTLVRFLRRRDSEDLSSGEVIAAKLAEEPAPSKSTKRESKAKGQLRLLGHTKPIDVHGLGTGMAVAAIIFCLFVSYYLPKNSLKPDQFDFVAFGRLPVAQDGRVKPMDSVGKNALILMRQRDTALGDNNKKIPATQWLLDVITEAAGADKLGVLKIDDPDVRKLLKLEDKPGHVFAFDDLRGEFEAFKKQVDAAAKRSKEDRTAQQRGILKIATGMENYDKLRRALTPIHLPSMERLQADRALAEKTIRAFQFLKADTEMRKRDQSALALPMLVADESAPSAKPKVEWSLVPEASLADFLESIQPNGERNAALAAYTKILDAYADNKPAEFNTAVARYESIIERMNPPEYNPGKLRWETWFNQFSPFYVGLILYLVAFLIAAIGWLAPSRTMSWTAFSLILFTFCLHTTALGFRLYISGRPPVTNLYSSAIFIGWFCVLIGLILELIFRIGIGNLVATICGFSTLIIASYLGMDGDTIGVLVAVLDTQFWLATHVVCITLGYGATYFAGFLGLLYVVLGMLTPRLDSGSRKILGRMIYGVTCFALFFSFFGTVLGGLWADDSWGRFWGWDPKENGALMIVMWNTLVLHARWDKMVGDRGLALLAIGGNIITSWSWFGVNGLNVGLHSYGEIFGVMETLAVFVLSQLAIILVGLAPLKYWWSVRKESPPGVT